MLGEPVDGRSLLPLISGDAEGDADEAISEYAAECASHPCFMIRRGRYKYIHCDVDPPLLFDTEDDPLERSNLVADPTHQNLAGAFAAEVAGRWDSEKIRQDVIATQKRRRAIHDAMIRGELTSWDYAPPRDASREYMRSHMDVTETDILSRFPPHGEA